MKRLSLIYGLALVLVGLLLFQNCSPGALEVDVMASGTPYDRTNSLAVGIQSGCYFNGKEVAEGSSETAYLNSVPDLTSRCVSESRTCENGILRGSFSYASCSTGKRACLFAGMTILHGQSVKAYDKADNFSCAHEMRICDDGVLTGSFKYSSCVKDACLLNGETIAPGKSFGYFKSLTGTCTTYTGYCHVGGYLVDSRNERITSPIYSVCSATKILCSYLGKTYNPGEQFKYSRQVDNCALKTAYCDSNGGIRDASTNQIVEGAFCGTSSTSTSETTTTTLPTATNTSGSHGTTTATQGTGGGTTTGGTGGSTGVGEMGGSSGGGSIDFLIPPCQWKGRGYDPGSVVNYYLYSQVYTTAGGCENYKRQMLCATGGKWMEYSRPYIEVNASAYFTREECQTVEPPPIDPP